MDQQGSDNYNNKLQNISNNDPSSSANVTKGNDHLINTLGVSQRLGSSVLDELDSRTNAKFEQLSHHNNNNISNSGNVKDQSFSQRFNISHDSQFRTMESVQTHYTVKFEGNETNDNIYQTPSKKNSQQEQLHSNSIKRLKTTPSLLSTPPPVLDITRRIRRLRLRNSLVGNGVREHHDSSITKSKIKTTPITKLQKPLEPPSFLRPTLNSLNRMKKSDGSINLHSKIKPQKLRIPSEEKTNRTMPRSSSSSFHLKNKMNPPAPKPKSSSLQDGHTQALDRRVKSTGSSNSLEGSSVFDRLYRQSTVSRSSSMNNINNHTKPGTSNNDAPNELSHSNSNNYKTSKISFGRSKTSSGLSNCVSNDSKSAKSRPAWR